MRSIILFILTLLVSATVDSGNQFNSFVDSTEVFRKSLKIKTDQLNFNVHTGYIPIDWYYPQSQSTSLFYELVSKQGWTIETTSPETPIIFWFEGGPGSSSTWSSFYEMGPFGIYEDDITLFIRKSSWNQQAVCVFVDQPLNVGLSYSDLNITVNSTIQSGQHIMNFFSNFYQRYPNLQQNPIYFFGQSYGGHYVPHYANQFINNENFTNYQFKGIGIGNAWVNPPVQNFDYETMMFSVGEISNKVRIRSAQEQLDTWTYTVQDKYFQATEQSEEILHKLEHYTDNMYNLVYPDEEDDGEEYLDWINDNKKGLGVPDQVEFNQEDPQIYKAFYVDINTSFQSDVESLVSRGIQVMVYSGQYDNICNTASALRWINQMNWHNLNSWRNTTQQIFLDNTGTVAGTYQLFSNFNFVVIYGAGHCVALSQGDILLEIVTKFINSQW